MLCDVCNKKQATVHLTEIVDEQMTELHLCEDCARQKSIHMEQQFGLSDLLAGLADFGKQVEGQELSKIKCSNCGLSYEDFKKIGRLGCGNCYINFKKYLIPLLKRIHGTAIHRGKSPHGIPKVEVVEKEEPLKVESVKAEPIKPKSELSDLKNKLQEVIRLENFEEAARLRDKIRELEEKASASDKEDVNLKDSGKKKKDISK